jgi:putative transposase
MSVSTVTVARVMRVVKVRMLPSEQQAAALGATLGRCNAAASWLSGRMHEERVRRKYEAQKRFYTELKERFGLSAQPAIPERQRQA